MRILLSIVLSSSAILGVLAACTGEDASSGAQTNDAGSDVTNTPLAPPPTTPSGGPTGEDAASTGPCDDEPFTAPTYLAEIPSSSTYPSMSPSGSELYVTRDSVVYRYTKGDGGTWGNEASIGIDMVGDGATRYVERFSFNKDGKYAFFGRRDPNDISAIGFSYIHRSDTDSDWTELPVTVALAGDWTNPQSPWISGDRARLYFHALVGGTPQIFVTKAAQGGATYGEPKTLGFGEDDRNPVLSADELRIYFSSHRAGDGIPVVMYTAKRPSLDDEFAPADPVDDLNEGLVNVVPSWLSQDSCTMLFSSDGKVSDGTNRGIYLARRYPK